MLTADDLLAPKGRVEGKSFFPDLSSTDLAGRLDEYLEQGYDKGIEDGVAAENSDGAARNYAYYRAFDSVYLSLISNPLSSTTTEGGSASYALEQAERFRLMAAGALEDYLAFVPVAATNRKQSATGSVKNKFVF